MPAMNGGITLMNLGEYQELARRTQNPKLSLHERKLHALFGISAEAGEISSIYQKAFQGHPVDSGKVADEMGDLIWFLAELSDVLRISLDEIAENNIDKLCKRYPEGFDAEHSVHRVI